MGLHDVMLDELRDLYSAETQLVKALPKLVKAAASEELKEALSSHLDETRGHVERLQQVFILLEEKPTGKHCNGMEGLIEEGKEAIDEEEEGDAYDAGLIGAAARVEHYEIAGYTAAIAMAWGMGHDEIAGLLEATLDEEDATREKLEGQFERRVAAAAASESSENGTESEKATNGSTTARTKRTPKSTKL